MTTPEENALLVRDGNVGRALSFSPAGLDVLRNHLAKDATPQEFNLFVLVCESTGLNPFARQIYAIKRGNRMTIQTGIDGLRLIAQRSGEYRGQAGPLWCGPEGAWVDVWTQDDPPFAAKVGVLREGFTDYLWAVARWQTYAQYFNGKLSETWASMPDLMLAKCYSPDTEVLTERGFQKFAEANSRILQVDAAGLSPVEVRPFAQQYSGPMVCLDSDDLNFSVTPNHDMLTTHGKVEAAVMFDEAQARPRWWIPRSVTGTKPDADIGDRAIELAAAYLADGADASGGFRIEVSRPRKIARLQEIGGWEREYTRATAGDEAATRSGRIIRTQHDKLGFSGSFAMLEGLAAPGKEIGWPCLLSLSRRQARIFADTLIEFDGAEHGSGTRRFYTSRPDHAEAFEVAAAIAGYTVSPRRARFSDISTKPNYTISVSERSEIPVIRWGRGEDNRSKANASGRTGITIVPNESGEVWCCTVPSGVIMVRRHGFAMLSGNCAEALALRRAFPQELSALYAEEEMQHLEKRRSPRRPAAVIAAPVDGATAPAGAGATEPAAGEAQEMSTERQQKTIHILLGKLAKDAQSQYALIASLEPAAIVTPTNFSTKRLTKQQADDLVRALEDEQGTPAAPPPDEAQAPLAIEERA